MITVYPSGEALIRENEELLKKNPYLSSFFYIDGAGIREVSWENYVLKAQQGENILLAMRAEPYDLLVYGAPSCAGELADCLVGENYTFPGFLCDTQVGEAMCRAMEENHQVSYYEALAMDFMEASAETEPSCPQVETAAEADTEEVCACLLRFVADCGLQDEVEREQVQKTIGDYRVIRENGSIVSMAKIAASTEHSLRICCVYTKDAFRGRGYSRKVVNTVKNEILRSGKLATLTVDRHNPVTNHLYRAIGFVPLFAQGEYRRK